MLVDDGWAELLSAALLPAGVVLFVVDSEVSEEDCAGGFDEDCAGGFEDDDEDDELELDDDDGGVEEEDDGGHDVDGVDEGGADDDEVEVDVEVEDEVEVGVGQSGFGGIEGGVEDDGGFEVPGLLPGFGMFGVGLFGAGFCWLLPVSGRLGSALTFSLYCLAHLRTVSTYEFELL